MPRTDIILAILAFFGHLAAWTTLCNRVQAMLTNRNVRWTLRLLIYIVNVGVPGYFLVRSITHPNSFVDFFRFPEPIKVSFVYCVGCWVFLVTKTLHWLWDRLTTRQTPKLELNHLETVNFGRLLPTQPATSIQARLLAWVPGNRPFDVEINEKQLTVAGLPQAYDGLTITHLSDFHLSGDISQNFFTRLVYRANELRSDITAITGDLIDRSNCFAWIPEIFGQLRSRYGVFYVLGNHEHRLGPEKVTELHQHLNRQGLVCLGGSWLQVQLPVGPLLMAGNSLPWCPPAPDMRDCPPDLSAGKLPRILLSHSPDQLPWARKHQFDLMLAGHTHGGQVRFPLIGPMICPSRFGTKYASGLFFETPTLLHVTRGISGMTPLRINCPPEITKLVLRAV